MWVELIKWIVIAGFLYLLLPQIKSLLSALTNLILNFSAKGKAQVKDIFSIDLSGNPAFPIGQQVGSDTRYIELLKAYQSPTITNEEKFINAKIAEAGCTNEQAKNVLIVELANQRVLFKMAFVDFTIYSEQVKLLFFLNVQTKALPESQLQRFLNEYQERSKDSSKTLEQFLNYLLDQRLINQNVDGYNITLLGKEYLSFYVRMGRKVPQDNEVDKVSET